MSSEKIMMTHKKNVTEMEKKSKGRRIAIIKICGKARIGDRLRFLIRIHFQYPGMCCLLFKQMLGDIFSVLEGELNIGQITGL